MPQSVDTIAAIATAPGRGGIGIVRLSGPNARDIAYRLTQTELTPRYAHFSSFFDQSGEVLDEGLVLFFNGPHSFTGEDVVELQGHGGPVVLDQVMKRVIALGARQARPGEFSERAFLNDKIDLTQAEAIADLINAESAQAARSAMRSLEGEFSTQIQIVVDAVIQARMYVEAAIDFPEEEIDFLAESTILEDSLTIKKQLETILKTASQGALLQSGLSVVIAGPPNAGKSSLLNALSGRDSAIVTDIAGTTRDVLREHIQLNGVPLHLVDTAGLRNSADVVEQEGIKRAHSELEKADVILLVFDASQTKNQTSQTLIQQMFTDVPTDIPIIVVKNKMDLLPEEKDTPRCEEGQPLVHLSVKQSAGLDHLAATLFQVVGASEQAENQFSARQRHIDALKQALEAVARGIDQLQQYNAGELFADDFRQAQEALGEITGKFSSDDLLGEIFSSFCIGK